MYNEAKVCVFNFSIEPKTSGSRTFTNADGHFDIDELHKVLLDKTKFAVLRNHISKWSDTNERQDFIVTNKVPAEEGYADSFIIACYGRNTTQASNRKVMLSFTEFGETPSMKATNYTA